ncbi:MAG TPA: hypothetical protein VMU84_10350 [Thermoanaerobaculia bacterium]|nr:hypothetical protein [Thermoanaerobaculia bacterium]
MLATFALILLIATAERAYTEHSMSSFKPPAMHNAYRAMLAARSDTVPPPPPPPPPPLSEPFLP